MKPSTMEQMGATDPETPFHTLMVGALPGLRQQAFALTRNRADADDLVQAAVTNALAAQHSFTPGTNFKAWMSRILRNRFLSDMRRRRETVEVDEAPADAFARAASQEDSIALQELRHALAKLPSDQRLALMMVTVQGMSYEEVSAQLGVAVGTLKCRVFRARKQLQAMLLGDAPAERRAVEAIRQGASPQPANRRMVNPVERRLGAV
ncbi:sigma-70 family RNA polymerase sigma factor [Roseococcus sp. DSY-14]|uniref:sigma-70 family RNA polymerase sigma factor n=1 Tax=Roseococcus sp. DSY-14 TaxID=3369650 RepID=UPI00387B5BF1